MLGSKAMADVDAFAANGKRGLGVDDAGQGRTKRMKPDSADPSSSMNGALPSEVSSMRHGVGRGAGGVVEFL